MSDEAMEVAYSRDSEARRLMDDAVRAIEALRRRDRAWARLSREDRDALVAGKAAMEKESAHIVAVWN